jgi:hypothetical protein
MPHHSKQNVLRKAFILFVCLNIVATKGASSKEEALALECCHSTGIAQGLASRFAAGKDRCGVPFANEFRQLCLDLTFRRRGQLISSPELVRPMAQVVKSNRAIASI